MDRILEPETKSVACFVFRDAGSKQGVIVDFLSWGIPVVLSIQTSFEGEAFLDGLKLLRVEERARLLLDREHNSAHDLDLRDHWACDLLLEELMLVH